MTVSEVAIALEQYTNDRRTRDPSYQPNLLVSKTIEYTNTISTNKNLDTVRKIRNLLAEAGMTETELALVVCVGYRVMCPVRDSLVCSFARTSLVCSRPAPLSLFVLTGESGAADRRGGQAAHPQLGRPVL
jgi:hypothetical protein